MTVDGAPHFLVLQDFHLSRQKAESAVIRTLKECDVSCPAQGWMDFKLKWNDDASQTDVRFGELVDEARRFGIVKRLQRYLDRKDSVFGGMIGESSIANWQIAIESSFAGFQKKVQGPCRSACVENELTEDILDFRTQACQHSNEYDFKLTSRYFRMYLFSCVSIVEAFVNRHVLIAQHEGFSSPEFDELKKATRLKDRVQWWFSMCSEDDPSCFFASIEWGHFQEIRSLRNQILHAAEPESIYSLKEIQGYLNRVRTGTGGLLLKMRTAHKKPTLGFIERLRSAPLVDFNKITFKSDGNHIIERQQAK